MSTDSTWMHLKPGDLVDVVAPSFGVSKDEVKRAGDYLRTWGLNPRIPEHILGDDPLCANDDNTRLSLLRAALHAEDSKAVWCLKGGYGMARLLPRLMASTPPATAKFVIGFSDITALHLFVNQQWKWPSLHAAVLWQCSEQVVSQETLHELKALLLGESYFHPAKLKPLNQHQTTITAPITGGNLTVLQNSIGTAWQIKPERKILLIEDIDEAPYRVDRMLTHLQQTGLLDEVEAIIFGDMTMRDQAWDAAVMNTILSRFAEQLDIPVWRWEGVGHGAINHPVPLGVKMTLDVDGTLSYQGNT